MLQQKKLNSLIAIIMIFIICLQFILFIFPSNEVPNCFVKKEQSYILTSSIHSSASTITNQDEKPFIKLQILNYKIIYYTQLSFQFKPSNYYTEYRLFHNSRQQIQKSISDHFHGSKYKGETFIA